jgi:hypothetical protein
MPPRRSRPRPTPIRSVLTADLLKEPYRSQVLAGAPESTGHCYVASEAYYHATGRADGFIPRHIAHEGSMHWFLGHPDGRLVDLTADQFLTAVPYAAGVGGGFLTRDPSKRAQIVLARAIPGWTLVPRPPINASTVGPRPTDRRRAAR